MIIQYCSDLHLEFKANQRYLRQNPLPVVGDVLILAGDIVLFSKMDDHKDFFDYISESFSMTYWLPGNHEYYYSDVSERSGFLEESIRSNLFLVNNCAIEQGDTRFLFSTLWSRISPANGWRIQNSLSDFQVIKWKGGRLSVSAFNELHDESVKFLSRELESNWTGKTIVASHHVPTFNHYPAKYKGDVLNEAFASELSLLIEQTGPDYWIFGHHHANVMAFKIGVTEMLTNQVGYVQNNEHQFFNGSCHFSV